MLYNRLLAALMERIADLLAIRGEASYRVQAYRRAAQTLARLEEDIRVLWREGRLESLPHIGPALAKKIDEVLRTGSLEYLERLEHEVPPGLLDLLDLPGLGPARVGLLWRQLGITSVDDLAQAFAEGRVRGIKGLGPKTLAQIQAALAQRGPARWLLDVAREVARALAEDAVARGWAQRAQPTGAVRRWVEAPPRVDVLALPAVGVLPEAWLAHPVLRALEAQTEAYAEYTTWFGPRVRVWWAPSDARWGYALVRTTGSEAHWRALVAQGGEPWPASAPLPTEAAVYAALGLPVPPPEWREAALTPVLRTWPEHLADVVPWDAARRAELHSHSTWSDGRVSIRAMAEAAMARGIRILAITDHSVSLRVGGGLSPERLRQQREEIRAVQEALGQGIRLLQGAEVDILPDGRLDYPDDVLASLDVVIASPHQALKQSPAEATRRLVRAVQNPYVHILGHPTGRMLPHRPGLAPDMARVIRTAVQHRVALEINANPHRLDLRSRHVRLVRELGGWLAINTDAHHPRDLDYWPFGLAVARRGWAPHDRILNTWAPERLLRWLREKRAAV